MGARLFEHPLTLLVIVLLIILLFGWKKMPDMARSLGRSSRILKSEIDQMKVEGSKNTAPETNGATATNDSKINSDKVENIDEPKPL